jgi:hypothetical protein
MQKEHASRNITQFEYNINQVSVLFEQSHRTHLSSFVDKDMSEGALDVEIGKGQ